MVKEVLQKSISLISRAVYTGKLWLQKNVPTDLLHKFLLEYFSVCTVEELPSVKDDVEEPLRTGDEPPELVGRNLRRQRPDPVTRFLVGAVLAEGLAARVEVADRSSRHTLRIKKNNLEFKIVCPGGGGVSICLDSFKKYV